MKIKGRNFTNRQISKLVESIMLSAAKTAKDSHVRDTHSEALFAYYETFDTIQNWSYTYFIKLNINLEKWIRKLESGRVRWSALKTEVEFEDRKYKKYEIEELLNRIFYYAKDAVKERKKDKSSFYRQTCISFTAIIMEMDNWLRAENIPVNFNLSEWVNNNLIERR